MVVPRDDLGRLAGHRAFEHAINNRILLDDLRVVLRLDDRSHLPETLDEEVNLVWRCLEILPHPWVFKSSLELDKKWRGGHQLRQIGFPVADDLSGRTAGRKNSTSDSVGVRCRDHRRRDQSVSSVDAGRGLLYNGICDGRGQRDVDRGHRRRPVSQDSGGDTPEGVTCHCTAYPPINQGCWRAQ